MPSGFECISALYPPILCLSAHNTMENQFNLSRDDLDKATAMENSRTTLPDDFTEEEARICAPWKPEQFLVDVGDGQPQCDILPTLADPSDPYNALKRGQQSLRIVFDPTKYPAKWESRRAVEQAIIEAGAAIDIPLVRCHSDRARLTTTIGCKFKCPYHSRNPRSALENVRNSKEPIYRSGVRLDQLVNNAAGNRPTKSGPRRTKTSKLPDDTLCPFCIRVRLRKLGEAFRWCIEPGTGYAWHKYHRRFGRDEQHASMNAFTEDEKKEIAILNNAAPSGIVRHVITEKMGKIVSRQQLAHIKVPVDILSDCSSGQRISGNCKGSHAEQLLTMMDSDKARGDIKYIALYHTVSSTSLLTISKRDQKNEWLRAQAAATTCAPVELQTGTTLSQTLEPCNIPFNEIEDSILKNRIQGVRECLKVGQNILLAVAWVRTDELKLFSKFPEILMVDVTHSTNSEGRPLVVTAGIDCYKKSFSPIRAYIPSECMWVFHWLWKTAIQKLLRPENCRRIQLVLTDGDDKIYRPFDQLKDEFYPNAVHGLCVYHLVTQPIQKLKRKFMGIDRQDVKEMVKM